MLLYEDMGTLPDLRNLAYSKKKKISVLDWRNAYNRDATYPLRSGDDVETNAVYKINDTHLPNLYKKDYLRKKNAALNKKSKPYLQLLKEKHLATGVPMSVKKLVDLMHEKNNKNMKDE